MSKPRGSVFQKQNGRWYVVTHYVDELGRERQRPHGGFATKREAERKRTQVLRELDTGDFVDSDDISVEQYLLDVWMPSRKHQLKPTTYASYQSNIKLHVVPYVGKLRLQALTASHLDRLYGDLLTSGRLNGERGGLSPRTVRYVHTIVRKALADAMKKGRITRNVADAADAPKVGRPREMAFWTPEQVKTLFIAIEDDSLRALWRLLVTTGMRRGEVVGIRWQDLDLDGARLIIRQSVVTVGYRTEVSTPKNDQARVVDLDAETVAVLKAHRATQAAAKLALGPDWTDSDRVFVREDGRPIHPEVVSKRFLKLVERAGLPRITLHGLRHTHVAILANTDVPVKVISERLGHATVAFTLDRYAHVLPGAQSEAAARFAAAVS
jgi:integrase